MNTQEYISSGIIESYVLGLASPEDAAEFEQRCATDPVVLQAREVFERELEASLRAQAVAPPHHLREQILAKWPAALSASKQAPVVAMESHQPATSRLLRYFTAASVVLLAGSIAVNFVLYNRYNDSVAKYDTLAAAQSGLADNNKALKVKLDNYDSAFSQLRSPSVAVIRMAGSAVPTSPDPASIVTVYWNRTSKDVSVLVNQLPKAPEGKQYQLWALVDGKPVDAGVFDADPNQSIVKLKTIPNAQAFAVTLEKTGGAVSPTMTAMYVLGKVTG